MNTKSIDVFQNTEQEDDLKEEHVFLLHHHQSFLIHIHRTTDHHLILDKVYIGLSEIRMKILPSRHKHNVQHFNLHYNHLIED